MIAWTTVMNSTAVSIVSSYGHPETENRIQIHSVRCVKDPNTKSRPMIGVREEQDSQFKFMMGVFILI